MTRSGFFIFICVLGLVLSTLLTAWGTPGGLELSVTLVNERTPLLVLPLNPGERFTLHYFHSVENAPIWEEHSMDEAGRLFIEEERYEKFGAGMGKMPGVGRMVKKGIYEAITDMHMPVGDFVLRVGSPGVDHTIIWRGRRFNLSETFAHKAVQFSGRPVSLLGHIWRTLVPGKFSYPKDHNG
jgi:hypothetical protein